MNAKPVRGSGGSGDLRNIKDRATMFLLGIACIEIGFVVVIVACGVLR